MQYETKTHKIHTDEHNLVTKTHLFPQHVLPLPCNACIIVTLEHRESNGITVSNNYRTLC